MNLDTIADLGVDDKLLLERRLVSRRFQLRYRDDPVAFVHDCFTWGEAEGPTPYQQEILAALPRERRVAVRGPHGLGKTMLSSVAVLWFALTRDGEDWKVPTTASVASQLSSYFWPEIHKWARRLRWDLVGRDPFDRRTELLKEKLSLETGHAFAAPTGDPSAIEGAHADFLGYVFDESKAIPEETFDAAEGAFSGSGTDTAVEAFALAISTPGAPVGRFFAINAREPGFEDWWVRHVTLAEAMAAGRISREWADARARQWGEDSGVYRNRVLGEFAPEDESGIIPLAWVEAANERWRQWNEDGRRVAEFTCVGCDIAEFGEDTTVLALRFGDVITELRRYETGDVMQHVGRIAAILRKYGGYARVDSVGMGTGVVARLRELGLRVEPFNGGERAKGRDLTGELEFVNARCESYWSLRDQLDPSTGPTLCLPPDDGLIGELTSPRWQQTSGGRIQLERKIDLKKRIGRSPDAADAITMACVNPQRHRGKLRVMQWS